MSKGRRDADYLDDMKHGIKKILAHLEGLTRDEFMENEWVQDATVRNIEIIGEAAKQLSEQTRALHAEVQWTQLIGMRDRLAHGYFAINLDVVWNTVQEDLPHLLSHVEALQQKLAGASAAPQQ
jgi:uncharacterized protein with HEPN domain